MGNKHILGFLELFTAALIWGTSFIAQAGAAKVIEAFTFNAVRSPMGIVILIPFIMWLDKRAGRPIRLFDTDNAQDHKNLLIAGFWSGFFMTAAVFFQTIGLHTTSIAKSGFITALYVILVPILGAIFCHTIVRKVEWLAALISCLGMYFICINETLSIDMGDIYTIICAFCFAGQVLTIGAYAGKVDGIRMSVVQLAVSTILSIIGMLIWENPSCTAIGSVMWELVYAGVLSSGVAYTLQIIGQAYVSAPTACITLCLESVFALLSGIIILNQIPTFRESTGCALVFTAVLLAQIPAVMNSRR
ncbi:MAG: DMT family transporter [Phascolarctobacterium sp.]|nr:DMT family transporter [Phascolarctobacterium sp.]